MNRIIKFRGKRRDNGQWVYGFLDYNPVECAFVIHEVGEIPPTWNEPGGDIYSKRFEVIPETVGQFSNKLDSETLEVYEGDIVQGGNGKMWEVIYSLTVSGWIISNKRIKDNGRNKFAGNEEYSFDRYRQLCKSAKTDTFKKIGNIHDNPELLNPLADSPALNTMTTDPKLPAEEVKEETAENVSNEQATEGAGEATQGAQTEG